MPKAKCQSVVSVFVDGASRGNPGPAAIGAALYASSGEKIAEVSRTIGETTNNVAEYLGVIYGLEEAFLLGARSVKVKTDSQLIARQLNGVYKVRDGNIKMFFDIARSLFRFFETVEIAEIPREENKIADLLANRALDSNTLL